MRKHLLSKYLNILLEQPMPQNPVVPGPSPIPQLPSPDPTMQGQGPDMPLPLGQEPNTPMPPQEDAESETDQEGEGVEESEDPVAKAVKNAKELLSQTRDTSEILKAMKQHIQTNFEKPIHAYGLVAALYDTAIPELRSVALRLYQFINAS